MCTTRSWVQTLSGHNVSAMNINEVNVIMTPAALNTSPLYAKGVHMLDGLADDKVDDFLEDHPTIIPLFEIDAVPTIGTPGDEEVTEETLPQDEPDSTTIAELRHARDAFE